MGYVVTPAFDPNKAEADGSLQLKASLIYIATVYCKFQDNQGYIEGPCPLKKKKRQACTCDSNTRESERQMDPRASLANHPNLFYEC